MTLRCACSLQRAMAAPHSVTSAKHQSSRFPVLSGRSCEKDVFYSDNAPVSDILCSLSRYWTTFHCRVYRLISSLSLSRFSVSKSYSSPSYTQLLTPGCTVVVRNSIRYQDEVHFEPPKLVVRTLDPRSADIIDESEIQNHEILLVQHFYIGTKIKLDPCSELRPFDLGSGKMLVQPGIRVIVVRTYRRFSALHVGVMERRSRVLLSPVSLCLESENPNLGVIASRKQSSDTHKTPFDRVKRCQERKIYIKASKRVNVDVFTQNKRPCPQHSQTKFLGHMIIHSVEHLFMLMEHVTTPREDIQYDGAAYTGGVMIGGALEPAAGGGIHASPADGRRGAAVLLRVVPHRLMSVRSAAPELRLQMAEVYHQQRKHYKRLFEEMKTEPFRMEQFQLTIGKKITGSYLECSVERSDGICMNELSDTTPTTKYIIEVLDMIMKLMKNRKAPGHYGINPEISKRVELWIRHDILLLNERLPQGCFAKILKEGLYKIFLLCRGGDKTPQRKILQTTNTSPSIKDNVGKITYMRLLFSLEAIQGLLNQQYGFRKARGPETAVMDFIRLININRDTRKRMSKCCPHDRCYVLCVLVPLFCPVCPCTTVLSCVSSDHCCALGQQRRCLSPDDGSRWQLPKLRHPPAATRKPNLLLSVEREVGGISLRATVKCGARRDQGEFAPRACKAGLFAMDNSLLPRSTELDSQRSYPDVHTCMGNVADVVVMSAGFLVVLAFPAPTSFRRCSILVFYPHQRITAGCKVQRYDGTTGRLARRSEEALGVRVSVALTSLTLLDLGRRLQLCCGCDHFVHASVERNIWSNAGMKGWGKREIPETGIEQGSPGVRRAGSTGPRCSEYGESGEADNRARCDVIAQGFSHGLGLWN
ncbi:hypothetical protein PR048_028516 [Dryococelus australis]|uniref:Reverse transcriptase domain-containing protein n=1 Tax=Dryococelus australis TaxID=614101 RepID=A0ABQ9GAT4_9NEOP|nr:hypothetical protein PR048_028516 [Dryococelus australis]